MKEHRLTRLGLAGLILLAALIIGLGGTFLRGRVTRATFDEATSHRFKSAHDLIGFLSSNGPRLSRPDMDAAVLRLLALQTAGMKTHEAQLFSDDLNPIINRYSLNDLVHLQNVKEASIRALVKRIRADELRLSSSEGMVYLELDYPRILERFGLNASPSMADYLDIMARETKRHFSEDGALIVSPGELGERLAAIEAFIDRNPRFARLADVKQLQSRYLGAFLLGLNNTPAFSYQTNRLTDLFMSSYQNFLQKHTGTKLAALLRQYLRVLDLNNQRKTQEVLDFAASAMQNP